MFISCHRSTIFFESCSFHSLMHELEGDEFSAIQPKRQQNKKIAKILREVENLRVENDSIKYALVANIVITL